VKRSKQHPFRNKLALNLGLTVLLLPIGLIAESPDHAILQSSDSLNYSEVFRAAMARTPELPLGDAYRDQAAAQQNFAGDWLASRPRATASYWDDQQADNQGMREMEAGVEMDLWRWGQRRDNASLGDQYRQASKSWGNYLALKIAGLVRQSLHELSRTDIAFAQAHRALDDTRELLRISETLHNTGSIARSALMQSRGLVLEAEQRLLDSEAALVDAQRNYQIVTGLHRRPSVAFSEERSQRQAIDSGHPLLGFLQDQAKSRQLQAQLARHDSAGNPTLFMGMRRERGSSGEEDIDSLGIAITMPFGGGNYISAKSSAARLAATEAEVRVIQAHRQLQQQLHEVEHQLESTRRSLELGGEQQALHRQHWQMAKKAFSLGETDILPAIQALQRYRESRLRYQLTELDQQRLVSEFNQTVGVLP
tara:strand:+ start:1633 stop:2901 length:1269 start_codon:yes stop_codon:yes gene_type:complete